MVIGNFLHTLHDIQWPFNHPQPTPTLTLEILIGHHSRLRDFHCFPSNFLYTYFTKEMLNFKRCCSKFAAKICCFKRAVHYCCSISSTQISSIYYFTCHCHDSSNLYYFCLYLIHNVFVQPILGFDIVKILNLLYHSFIYSLVSLLLGIYPLPAMHSLLVTLYYKREFVTLNKSVLTIYEGVHITYLLPSLSFSALTFFTALLSSQFGV